MYNRLKKKQIENKKSKDSKIETHEYIAMNVWARIIGIPYHEFVHMPIGELSDLIDMYQRINGYAKADEINESLYIPDLE